jgi:hypothetical protein
MKENVKLGKDPFPAQAEFIDTRHESNTFTAKNGADKTTTLIMASAHFRHYPGYRGVIILPIWADTEWFIPEYLSVCPHAGWDGSRSSIAFPSGAEVLIAAQSQLDQKVRMAEFHFIGADDSRLKTEDIDLLRSRLRAPIGGRNPRYRMQRFTYSEDGAVDVWNSYSTDTRSD